MKIEERRGTERGRAVAGHAERSCGLTIGENLAALAAGHRGEDDGCRETISVLEANLDDLNHWVFGYVMDRLFDEGALDAFGAPVQMKKNRPGTLLTVLCKPEDAGKLTQLIFTETTTLGVRRRDEHGNAGAANGKR